MNAEGPGADLDAIAERYLERLHSGEEPDPAAVLSSHPEMAAALARRLKAIDRLHRVGRGLSTGGSQPPSRLRCPHCGTLLKFAPEESQEVSCPGCGSSFKVSAGMDCPGKTREVPARIGRFEVETLLGRGAFGAVYRARDGELQRTVAVKVPRSGFFAAPEDEERFLREARAAAQLKHPSIVRVHEIGHDRGVPFIVSEYIPNRTLAELIAANRPSFREAAALVARLAEALDYAHAQGVIHRDLKPSNILIDPSGAPHVSDFGLARRGDEDVTVTIEGQILGTPAYMAPEQAAGDHARVDAGADQYALGVILYEILTGERPFRGSKARLIRQVLYDEPRAPSSLNDHIPRDLETVCLKAMAKDPARRYPGVRAFAEDLHRFLRHEPIVARPATRAERAWRWARRNPEIAVLTAAVAALLVAGTAVSSVMAIRTARARDQARERLLHLNVAAGARLLDEGDVAGAIPWFLEACQLDRGGTERQDLHRLRLAAMLESCPRLLHVWFHDDRVLHAEFSPSGGQVLSVTPGAVRIWDTETSDLAAVLEGGRLTHAGFDPSGERLAVCSHDGTTRLWRWRSAGQPILLQHEKPVSSAAFSPAGDRVLTVSGGAARLWDAAAGEPSAPPFGTRVTQASFSPDGSRVVTAEQEGARIWNATTGEPAAPEPLRHGDVVVNARFSPDGSRVVTAGVDSMAQVWNAITGARVGRALVHGHRVIDAAFTRDGSRVVTASWDTTVRVWDAATGAPREGPFQHAASVSAISLAPDGRRAVTSSAEGFARVWDLVAGTAAAQPLIHGRQVNAAAFHPDGRRLLSASRDGTVKLWDLSRGPGLALPLEHQSRVNSATFSPDGRTVLTSSFDGTARLWDAATGDLLRDGLLRHNSTVVRATFSPDGSRILTATAGGMGQLWEAATRRRLGPPLFHGAYVHDSGFSPDGRLAFTSSQNGEVRVWDAVTGERAAPPIAKGMSVISAGFSPDGRRVLSAGRDGHCIAWDLRTGDRLLDLVHSDLVYHGAFSPDGRLIATASQDGQARIWDVHSPDRPLAVVAHRREVIRVRFSPDGERLLTASYDGTARLWKVPAGEPLGLPMAREGLIQDALFSADGRLIVTASYDGSACVWDGFSGEPITPVLHQGVRLSAAEFSPDGSRVVTGNYEGVARIWTLPRPSGDLEHLERLAKLYAGHEIDAGGAALAIAGEESRGLFQSLSAEHPEEFTAGAGDLLAWHAREAGECGAAGPWADDGRWTGVEAHLDALIAEDPGRASLHARRGHVRAALRRWEDASGDFAQAIAIDPENEHHYYPQALLRLRLGDAAGYAALCAGMFERFGGLDVAQTRDLVAWTASVGPGALRDPEAAMALAQRAVDRSPANFAFKNTLAATAYRAGRWEEAIRFLDASIAAEKKEGQPLDWVFYALAEARRGRAQEAAGWLAKARAHRDGMRGTKAESAIDRVQLRWYILLELELLVAEGEALIAAGN